MIVIVTVIVIVNVIAILVVIVIAIVIVIVIAIVIMIVIVIVIVIEIVIAIVIAIVIVIVNVKVIPIKTISVQIQVVADMVNPEKGEKIRQLIDDKSHSDDYDYYGPINYHIDVTDGTTHLSVLDKEGNAVSLTTSINK